MKCCFCNIDFEGDYFGNNPFPIILGANPDNKSCCELCNWDFVAPIRIVSMRFIYNFYKNRQPIVKDQFHTVACRIKENGYRGLSDLLKKHFEEYDKLVEENDNLKKMISSKTN